MKCFGRIAALALVLALGGVAIGGAQTATGPVIRVAAGPDDPSMPLIYAAQSGMFARAGLNVELSRLPGAAAIAAAMAGGSVDIGKGATMSVVNAFAKGLPFTIISNISEYRADDPDIALVTLTNSGITGPKDFVGKILADVSLTDQNSVATFAWLDQHGVDSSTLKFVEIPASAALAAMDANRVVGSTIYEPVLSAVMATGRARIIGYPYDAIGKRFSSALLFAPRAWADEHRELVQRFLRVVGDACVYVSAHENEMGPASAAFGGVDAALIAKMKHTGRQVTIAPADIQPVIDTAAKYHVIPKAFPANDIIWSGAPRPRR
jgi:NitT/TauT family transport system substrate-binding protein